MIWSVDQAFRGFPRREGAAGTRNHLLILPAVVCANIVAEQVARALPKAMVVTHQHGCAHIAPDRDQVFRTLVGFGSNPNVGATLVVGLGCENVPAEDVARAIGERGTPVECLLIQKEGGARRCSRKAVQVCRLLMKDLAKHKRECIPLEHLVVGTECGGSDFTSGLAANPAVGRAADLIVSAGGTVVLSETSEFIGAEHILQARAKTEAVAEAIGRIVYAVEAEVRRAGVDIRGANPAPGNLAGGLTTIEEKSLGCVHKGGASTISEVVAYSDRPIERGLVIMDTPGHDVESVTGMAAGGCQIMLFTTGRGTPVGCPIVPVIKATANEATFRSMREDMDEDLSPILKGQLTIEDAGRHLLGLLLEVASGRQTAAERSGNREFAISTFWRSA